MKFSLSNHKAVLSHVNVRSEMIGDEPTPACDLKIRIDAPNDILASFDPHLRDALYFFDASAGRADLVDQGRAGDPGYKPHLRFPHLATPLRWELGVVDPCDVVVSVGNVAVRVTDCRVNNFQITPLEGGTVTIDFRVQTHPDAQALGTMGTWVQKEIDVSVTPQTPLS